MNYAKFSTEQQRAIKYKRIIIEEMNMGIASMELIPKDSINRSVKKGLDFIERLAGPSIDGMGGLLGDQVKFIRFKNKVNIALKAQAMLEKKGISPKNVPLKLIVPLLEQASLEEDEELQNIWAALLANSANPTCICEIHSSYVEILKQLSALEFRFLEKLLSEIKKRKVQNNAHPSIEVRELLKKTSISQEQCKVMIENLVRLNLITKEHETKTDTTDLSEKIKFSALGYDFMGSCSTQ